MINYLQNFDNNPINTLQNNLAQGLANQTNAFNLQQLQQKAEQEEAYNALKMKAMQTGDISQLRPEDQQVFMQTMAMKQGLIDRDAGRTAFGIIRALQSGDTNLAKTIIAQNADDINSLGDPSFTAESALQLVDTDPETLANMSQGVINLTGFDTGEPAGLTENQRIQADLRQQEINLDRDKLNNDIRVKDLEAENKKLANEAKLSKNEVDIAAKQQQIDKNNKEIEDKKKSSISNINETIKVVDDILSDDNFNDVVGTVDEMFPTFSKKSQDTINKFNRLQSLLTVDNLKLMTGVLTDRDISFLTNVASGLNVTEGGVKGSEKGVKKRLNEIKQKLNEKLKANGVDIEKKNETVNWSDLP